MFAALVLVLVLVLVLLQGCREGGSGAGGGGCFETGCGVRWWRGGDSGDRQEGVGGAWVAGC